MFIKQKVSYLHQIQALKNASISLDRRLKLFVLDHLLSKLHKVCCIQKLLLSANAKVKVHLHSNSILNTFCVEYHVQQLHTVSHYSFFQSQDSKVV